MDQEFRKTMRIEKLRDGRMIYPVSLSHLRENTFGNATNRMYGGRTIAEHEIYVVVEGEVTAYVGDQVYHPKRGTVFTYMPEEAHKIYVTSLNAYERYVLLFHYDELTRLWDGVEDSLLQMFTKRRPYENNRIQLSGHETQRLLTLLEKATCYCEHSRQGEEALFYADFMKILHLVNQGFLHASNQQQEGRCLPVVSTALAIIDEHFATLQSVSQLSGQLHISDSYLARVFKKQVGTSVYEYILNMKFAHAVKLLAAGKSVTEACFDSGFNSYSHFIQMFKRKYGTTPLKYQKSLDV